MKRRDAVVPTTTERIADPSYGERNFLAELGDHRRRYIDQCREKLDAEKDPEWRKIWENFLAKADDVESMQWLFIHEFTRLMPGGLDRENGVINQKLQEDLDAIIRRYYNFDQYVELKNKKDEMIRLERRRALSTTEKDELSEIDKKLGTYDLKLLYIEMRKLGYTKEDLNINYESNK